MTDWAALYRTHVETLAALTTHLDEEALSTVVLATPAWTVHDVLAHLAGVSADNLTGRTEGAPSPTWTARHVGERAHLPVADLVEELRTNQDALTAGFGDTVSTGVVWDLAVHHADLHESLGRHMLPEPLWRPVLDEVAPHRAPGLVEVVPAYELFRALFSRRSQAQLRAWGTVLDDAALADLGVFGTRDDDQPVPA